MSKGDKVGTDALTQARDKIARQEAIIADLRSELGDERFAGELREALVLGVTAGTVAAPVGHDELLKMIVETAAQVISAGAASLFLVDAERQELIFEVAVGGKAAEVARFRVPLGHGVAGLVAVTGQSMALSDAENDPRQASDISEKIGYRPTSLLCIPLFYGDRITGVLEMLDKEGGAPFSSKDMELLGLFGNLAGVAIEQSRAQQSLALTVESIVESLEGMPAEERQDLLRGAREFAFHTATPGAPFQEALEIARLVNTIAANGETASQAVGTILRGFADYLESSNALRALDAGQ